MALPPTIERQIRLLIPDVEEIYGETGDEYMFTSDDIANFYAIGNANIKQAAGYAKITVGSSEALIGKVITNYETKTDGASLMKQWTAAGNALIAQGIAEVQNGVAVLDYFDVVYPDYNPTRYEGLIQGWPGDLDGYEIYAPEFPLS